MSLKNLTIEKFLTPYNFNDRPAGARKIEYIVIHYFGSLGTAKAVANYFANAYRGASAHYCLDEGSVVYQCVEDEDIAWHCGTKGTYYSACRNSNSIGIEVRPYILDKSQSSSAEYRGWYFTDAVVENLVVFTKYLMKKYNIDADHVIRHYDVTHKWCPRPWYGDDINLYHNDTGNNQWAKFKARLVEKEEEDMPNIDDLTPEQAAKLWYKITEHLRDNDSAEYSAAARQFFIDNGLIFGTGGTPPNYQWEAPVTREQFVTLAYRVLQFIGRA